MLKCTIKSTLCLFKLLNLAIFFIFSLLLFSGYLAAEIIETEQLKECLQKTFDDSETFVCVCNAEHCDETEPLGLLAKGKIVFYLSDKEKNRMKKVLKHFPFNKTDDNKLPTLTIDSSTRFQTIIGFGGAFTDSVGINLNSLSATTRESLIRNYFHPEEGIGYSIGRVPIASTDFSTREYSYVEQEGDFDLRTFALAKEDFEAKIPYIKMARRYRIGQPFRLLAAPWASPGWMKTNGRMNGGGELKGDLNGPYYQSYAKYLKKFFDEYHKNEIDFWALTIQNQPESGLEEDFPFQNMFMSNHTQREFAKQLLLPLFQKSEYTVNLKLIAFDDVREHLFVSASEIFNKQSQSSMSESSNDQACSFLNQLPLLLPDFIVDGAKNFLNCPNEEEIKNPIDGIGVHWYVLDKHEDQNKIHELYNDKFIISTEACTGFDILADFGPRIGNWTRGWMYGHDIVHNLKNWAIGWIDWNICLNMEGGPNWVKNYVDAPILVDGEKDLFYKQPMFYFIAHFSKFIPPGSVRINTSLINLNNSINLLNKIDNVAFITPRGEKIIILINPNEEMIELNIKDLIEDREMKIELEPNSIMTAIWT